MKTSKMFAVEVCQKNIHPISLLPEKSIIRHISTLIKVNTQSLRFAFSLAIIVIAAGTVELHAQSAFSIKSSTATINGGSTLHDWESKITTVEFKGSVKMKGNILQCIKNVEVKIPVLSIKSKEGKVMDDKTYETFEFQKNPFIIYTCSDTKITEDAQHNITITASGKMSMAGVTKPYNLEGKGKILANGNLQLTISSTLKMSDFGMKPPTLFMGTITVGDEITVHFNIELEQIK
jgi:polyisoprenoid-binding protein YceI